MLCLCVLHMKYVNSLGRITQPSIHISAEECIERKKGHIIQLRNSVDLRTVTPSDPFCHATFGQIGVNQARLALRPPPTSTTSTILLGSVAKRHLSTSIANYDINTRAGRALHEWGLQTAYIKLSKSFKFLSSLGVYCQNPLKFKPP